MSVSEASKDVFENVVLSLRELSALDRWGESTEVKDTYSQFYGSKISSSYRRSYP